MKRLPRRMIGAAQVYGDSMIDKTIHHGDVALFWCSDIPDLHHGEVIVIERIGDEEGWGAWALKKLIVEKPRALRIDEYDEEIDSDDPIIVLRSANPSVSPRRLEKSGEYRVRGVFFKAIPVEDVRFVESEWIRGVVRGRC